MREEALVHYRSEERPLLKRLHDLVARVEKTGRPALTEFLTPRERRMAEGAVKNTAVAFAGFGGYTGAERVRGCFYDAGDTPLQLNYQVACLRVTFWSGDGFVRHGDVLGSLIGLGIERDRVGDIAILDSDAYIFCTETVAPIFLGQWTKAGRVTIVPRQIELSQVPDIPAPKLDEKVFTLQSLRLDAYVAHAFGMSRAKAIEPIETGKVALNFSPCTNPSTEIDVEDIISLRGSGRTRVLSLEGESRSGRTFIRIGRYV
ncbi:MAG: YlmH/Sll1252 family protein [Firmicutes bacterium]|nr:YlmH/Sll1252 family protein [Bacillota bacterium]